MLCMRIAFTSISTSFTLSTYFALSNVFANKKQKCVGSPIMQVMTPVSVSAMKSLVPVRYCET